MKKIVGFGLVVFVLTSVAQAGPLEPAQVAADAKWFGHVNVEAIGAVPLVKECRQQCEKNEHAKAKIKEVTDKLGMNPMDDLLGITVYATQYEGDVGVGLFSVRKMDREKLVALFKQKHPDHKTAEYAGRTLYTWTEHHHGKEMTLTGTFANDKTILIGADAEHVKAALDVLDGKKPALAKDAPLIQGLAKNALFVSRAVDVPAEYRQTTKCPVLRVCSAASVQWTEKGGQLSGKYDLTADSPETAKNLKAAVDGMKALVELRFGTLESVKKVLSGVQCKAKDNLFSASVKVSLGDLRAAAEDVKQQVKQHIQEHGKKRGKERAKQRPKAEKPAECKK